MTIKAKGYDITGTPEEVAQLIRLLADEPVVKALDALTNNVMVIPDGKVEVVTQTKPARKPRKVVDWGKAKALRDAGWTYKAIADELGVSDVTVAAHLNKSVKATSAVAAEVSRS